MLLLQKLKKFVYGVNQRDIIFSSKAEKHILYFFKKRIKFLKNKILPPKISIILINKGISTYCSPRLKFITDRLDVERREKITDAVNSIKQKPFIMIYDLKHQNLI